MIGLTGQYASVDEDLSLVAVPLTTQYLEEADAFSDEISVIDHGRSKQAASTSSRTMSRPPASDCSTSPASPKRQRPQDVDLHPVIVSPCPVAAPNRGRRSAGCRRVAPLAARRL